MAEWRKFAAKQKAKRKGKQGNEADGVEEIVVQRMSTDVCGKQQKYARIGAQEYVPFEHEEFTIDNIKDACLKHFREQIESGLICDVLAGERGPCYSGVTGLHSFTYIINIWVAYSHILFFFLIKFCFNKQHVFEGVCSLVRYVIRFCEKISVKFGWFSIKYQFLDSFCLTSGTARVNFVTEGSVYSWFLGFLFNATLLL